MPTLTERKSVVTGLVLIALTSASPAVAGQVETCVMDDKQHVATYSCPKDYEVVYTGAGTKTCDGACYRKGDTTSLLDALVALVKQRQNRSVSRTDMRDAAEKLLAGKIAVVGDLKFEAPK